MPHDHHRCECEHERLKFCRKCSVVHCLDCKAEWQEPCTRPHSLWWPYAQSYTIACGTGTVPTTTDITWSHPSTTVCEH